MADSDIVAELRECADLVETITEQASRGGRREPLTAEDAERIVTALRDGANRIEHGG
jgi:hypothetical protein